MSKMGDSRWRPVRIRDEASVRYLNSLFAKGWYLMDLGLDDLPFLYFLVPLEPGKKRPKIASELTQLSIATFTQKGLRHTPPVPIKGSRDHMPVLVLTKGKNRGMQKAVAICRDETGYIDMRKGKMDPKEWRSILTIPMEAEGYVMIYQKRGLDSA
jgi:hypothetical protein